MFRSNQTQCCQQLATAATFFRSCVAQALSTLRRDTASFEFYFAVKTSFLDLFVTIKLMKIIYFNVVVSCATPVAPENGRFDNGGIDDYTFGAAITYICDAGYTISDASLKEARCDENGSWGEVPQCFRK